MLGGLKFKKDPESWLGLVDGIYGVSMTLLIVSTPSVIKGMVTESKLYYSGPIFFDLSLLVHLVLFTVLSLALFIISCDTWSFQRRQLKNMQVMDHLHSLYHIIGLFCAVLFPSIFLLRWSYTSNYHVTIQDMVLDWTIASLLILVYFVLLNTAAREGLFNARRESHRTKRTNDFSVLTLKRRLRLALSLASIFFIARLAGLHHNGSALFLPIFSFIIIVERWARFYFINSKAFICFRYLCSRISSRIQP